MKKAHEYGAIPIEDTGFILQEFIPPEILEQSGEWNSKRFVNLMAVQFLKWVKDYYGGAVVNINNWFWLDPEDKTALKYRGYRPPSCKQGAPTSDHRRSGAIDFDVEGATDEEVRELIRDNWKYLHRRFGLTIIESDTKGWVHAGFTYTGMKELFEIPYYG